MMSRLFHFRKLLLLVASVGNLFGAFMALAFPAWFMEQLFNVPPQAEGTFPYLPLYHYTFWSFVLIMGIGYWMTAFTPEKNRAVLFIGGAGKIVAALFWALFFSQGFGNWLMISGAIYDGLFGIILFLLFFAKPEQKVDLQ